MLTVGINMHGLLTQRLKHMNYKFTSSLIRVWNFSSYRNTSDWGCLGF